MHRQDYTGKRFQARKEKSQLKTEHIFSYPNQGYPKVMQQLTNQVKNQQKQS